MGAPDAPQTPRRSDILAPRRAPVGVLRGIVMPDIINRPLTQLLSEQTGRRWCQSHAGYAPLEGGATRPMRGRHGTTQRWECAGCRARRRPPTAASAPPAVAAA